MRRLAIAISNAFPAVTNSVWRAAGEMRLFGVWATRVILSNNKREETRPFGPALSSIAFTAMEKHNSRDIVGVLDPTLLYMRRSKA